MECLEAGEAATHQCLEEACHGVREETFGGCIAENCDDPPPPPSCEEQRENAANDAFENCLASGVGEEECHGVCEETLTRPHERDHPRT